MLSGAFIQCYACPAATMKLVQSLRCCSALFLLVSAIAGAEDSPLEKRNIRPTNPLFIFQQALDYPKTQATAPRYPVYDSNLAGHTMIRRGNSTSRSARMRAGAVFIPWTSRPLHGSFLGKSSSQGIEIGKQQLKNEPRPSSLTQSSNSGGGSRDISRYSRLFSISLPVPREILARRSRSQYPATVSFQEIIYPVYDSHDEMWNALDYSNGGEQESSHDENELAES